MLSVAFINYFKELIKKKLKNTYEDCSKLFYKIS